MGEMCIRDRYMGVEEETSAAKSSDKTLYYNDGAMHYKGVEYELPTAVTVLKLSLIHI